MLLLVTVSYSAEYEITPHNEYKPEIIGKFYRFKEPMTYLVISESESEFLIRNNNIDRILATTEQATGNDVHTHEEIYRDMVFEVVSIFNVKETTPPPEDWSEEDKQAYLIWRDQNWLGIEIELRDESGVISTVSEYNFKYSYDVTTDRDLIVRPYTYEITPKVREQIIKFGKRMGDEFPDNEEQFQRYVATVVSPQIMLAFQMNIFERCSTDISTQCNGINNTHEIIHCLNENRNQISNNCESSLVNVIDSKPIDQQIDYYDINFPPGSQLIYRYDSNDTEPVVIGALVPDNETVTYEYYLQEPDSFFNGEAYLNNEKLEKQKIVYGPGRLSLYKGKILAGKLAHPQNINGVIVKGSIDNEVRSGMLREAMLDENVIVQGIEYAKDTKILFRDLKAGLVISGALAHTQSIQGVEIPGGHRVHFDDQGVLLTIEDENGNFFEGFKSKSYMMN